MPVKEKPTQKKNTEKNTKDAAGFPIIGIGASAGGLETLNDFFSVMPHDGNMAFVVIQHLSPQHTSIMASLLDKHTKMSVREIKDGTKLEPDHVYLNPPGKNVAVFNRRLHLLEPVKNGVINMPIDFFFRSLSEDQGEKAIGIILSGTASDGTLGIKAIKGEGGMAMVQQPDTAKYDGMPRSAIETGVVDFILPVEKMPEALIGYVRHPFLESPGKIRLTEPSIKNQIQKIFSLIRSATGHDFSHYKQTTISRRIERRLAVHQIKGLSDYILYIQTNPSEIDALFKNMVIGVTSFFRDPEAWAVLEQEALPKLLNQKEQYASIRCWVAGCSTGEEAYSLAMVLSETMDRIKRHFDVQIFATDIDQAAVETARRAVYPESIGEDVPPERLNKYFTKEAGCFKIKKQIRDMIAFSIQSIVKDPPFSRLDLASCRNLMIYMDNILQKKILPMFHYTLNPGGMLFLGTSEGIGDYADLFKPLNSKWKIFERKKGDLLRSINYPREIDYGARQSPESGENNKHATASGIQAMVEKAILDKYAPTGVLINDKYEILHFVGNTDRYLMPPTGKPSFNILDMAREGLKNHLATTVHKAVHEKMETVCEGVRIKYNDVFYVADISVKPMPDKGPATGFMLVVFEDKTSANMSDVKKPVTAKVKKHIPALQNLEYELQSTREYLQATIEELETSNEELKSNNEELQSVNEELQSANEELETSREELQSTNEELATVNAELQNKVEDSSKVTNDMNNLMAATEIAVIFIDTGLCIKRYTPATARIINLIPTDIGRPLNDLKTSFPDVDIAGAAGNVLKDLNTIEMEILSNNYDWYAVKIMPYRTIENVIDGVVLIFSDISKVKQADKIRRLATLLKDSHDAIILADLKGNILDWNKGAGLMYGWTEREALMMNMAGLLTEDKQGEIESIIKKINKGETIKSFKTRRKTKDGKILDVWTTITALANERGKPIEFAATERDLAWLMQEIKD